MQSLLGAARPGGPDPGVPVALARDGTGALLIAESDTILRLDGADE